jgi:hypothetical protein
MIERFLTGIVELSPGDVLRIGEIPALCFGVHFIFT